MLAQILHTNCYSLIPLPTIGTPMYFYCCVFTVDALFPIDILQSYRLSSSRIDGPTTCYCAECHEKVEGKQELIRLWSPPNAVLYLRYFQSYYQTKCWEKLSGLLQLSLVTMNVALIRLSHPQLQAKSLRYSILDQNWIDFSDKKNHWYSCEFGMAYIHRKSNRPRNTFFKDL